MNQQSNNEDSNLDAAEKTNAPDATSTEPNNLNSVPQAEQTVDKG
jgi:hypothetical protein